MTVREANLTPASSADREPELIESGGTARLHLTLATTDYDHVRDLVHGIVRPEGITLTAFVSPYRADRDAVRKWVEERGQPGDFIEVFVDAPLEVCEARDPKGLYKKARAGEIPHFTGIHDPYEAPLVPDLHLLSADKTPDLLAAEVLSHLKKCGKIA